MEERGVMKKLYIMEDEIPRDGGVWPECAATFFICADVLKESTASGRVWTLWKEKPVPFDDFGCLLLVLDRLLDEMGQPASWCELRTLLPKGEESIESGKFSKHGKIFYFPDEMMQKKGMLGTAAVRIYTRQHASMQGELRILNHAGQTVSFRSALELLHLLEEWLIGLNKNYGK